MERPTLARALYTNSPEAPGELGFRKGEILTVIEIDHDGQPNWWLCTIRGQRGICPSNYLELLEDKYALHHHHPHHQLSKNERSKEDSSTHSRTPSTSTLTDEPLQDYDVPRSCRQAAAVTVNPLDLYDVPRSGRLAGFNATSSSDSLVRGKNGQSELSLLSTGSSTHLSSSSSSSARSSASCELNGTLMPTDTSAVTASNFFTVDGRRSGASSSNKEDTESIISGKSNEDHQLYENFPPAAPAVKRVEDYRPVNCVSGGGGSSSASVQELYDVPRSEPTSRAHSSMSMSSGLGLSIANSDSKDSLELYDVPRNGSSVQAYVNHLEAKYDRIRSNAAPSSYHNSTQRKSEELHPNDLYDIPRSSQQPPQVVARNHLQGSKLSTSMASVSICSDGENNLERMGSHSKSVDLRRRGFILAPGGGCGGGTKAMSCQQLNSQHSNNNSEYLGSGQSTLSLHSQRLNSSAGLSKSTATITSSHSIQHVKILPLNPRAAVTVCEKLRQEVMTSIKSVLDFVKPKWRSKENLTDIMPDLRFASIRLNLAVKDMVNFCSRSLSNAKKFSIEAHVVKIQRLLTPLINGSQIIQRDVDELEAYFWSAERLSRPGDVKGTSSPSDALDQMVLCAKSLQHDVTEISNFLALNSTALYREADRINGVSPLTTSTLNVATDGPSNNVSGEDYDYVNLVDDEEKKSNGAEDGGGLIPQLAPSDEQLLEFYSTQIASIAPLLSESISTFISSIQQNDPPKTFNGHLKYVILLAYKMLFAGDTIHRNMSYGEMKEEVERKANDLHKSIVALHEASRAAARDFPRIPPMQAIVDRVWETTAAATQLKKVIFNAASL